jgi:hypothetical protein
MPAVREQAPSIHSAAQVPIDDEKLGDQTETITTGIDAKPYKILRKPVPATGYANYPNYTPATNSSVTMGDTRYLYPEIEDNTTGQLWADEEPTHKDDIRLVEWSQARARRERWVGPMMYVLLSYYHYH